MHRKRYNIGIIIIFTILVGLLFTSFAWGDYWVALPPYNVLWPLWSPPLSPVDPVTGAASPLVTSLARDTVLTVQPALIWDPASPEANNAPLPWLAYNTPAPLGGGLLIWDQYYGLRPFPPDYMIDPVSLTPLPIPLPLLYSLLKPIDYDHIWLYELSLGNVIYAATYGASPSSLLTPQDIWGLPDITLPVL
ncbi:MAG: hypothetical protein ACMUJM_04775 [bacterium]